MLKAQDYDAAVQYAVVELGMAFSQFRPPASPPPVPWPPHPDNPQDSGKYGDAVFGIVFFAAVSISLFGWATACMKVAHGIRSTVVA